MWALPPTLVVASFFLLCSPTGTAAQVSRLPQQEEMGLRYVGDTLGGISWNFSSSDPCSDAVSSSDMYGNSRERTVGCNCSYENATVCHVTSLILTSLSLEGTLPSDLSKLPYLKYLNLSRNCLSGPIPPQWGSTKLVAIFLLGNQLRGSVPEEIGNITTLQALVLESNQLSGKLPSSLGNLRSLRLLNLGSNNFTGDLPASFGMLTSLAGFSIRDNNFVGQIPTFILNWTNIVSIQIQASGLSGPIPSEIGLLKNLIVLMISDLNGASSPFPSLNHLTNLRTLILRSCNIAGVLPDDFGGMVNLEQLDLSFNKISGQIPPSLRGLARMETLDLSFNKISGQIPPNLHNLAEMAKLLLTGNLLNGSVPDWMLDEVKSIDLSYNKFTSLPSDTGCQYRNLNLFASSSVDNNFNLVSCLANRTCARVVSHLHINCGGKEETIDGVVFEGDEDRVKPSQFLLSKTNWALSNSGNFMNVDSNISHYVVGNSSALSMINSKLYESARLSPLSLTYYAYCMANGNYTISLHFAEIMFSNNKSYSSLGRRIFDVYVQGRLVLKDFNIVDAAGGIGIAVIKTIHVAITSGTLEIRFYWAGKGTLFIPVPGVYGPLISAISIEPANTPSEGRSTLPLGAIVGIILAGVAFIMLLALRISWWIGYFRRKAAHQQDLKGQDLLIGSFTLKQIRTATNNFDASNKIGEGGFGPVYKGILSDGTVIAVKQLSAKSKQGNREFVNEMGLISSVKHPNLVKLYGCCTEGDQLLLVYEYMENNCLAQALFGPRGRQLRLDWATRQKICIGIAKGLAFLHEESRLKIVHRDIKSTNVLLDKNLNPKISDFGLAKLDEEDNTHISTRIAGTYGYMAPEYASRGHLTDKADVYSFGIVALEIVCGRSNNLYQSKDKCLYLLDWALVSKDNDSLMELVDPKLGSNFDKEEAMTMINIAFLCTNVSPSARPTMSSVVSMLEGKAPVNEFVSDPDDMRKEITEMWTLIQQNEKITDDEDERKTESTSLMGIQSTDSSTSKKSRNKGLEQHL